MLMDVCVAVEYDPKYNARVSYNSTINKSSPPEGKRKIIPLFLQESMLNQSLQQLLMIMPNEEEEADPNPFPTDHLLDWLPDPITFSPSFIDTPYTTDGLNSYQWWDQDLINESSINSSSSSPTPLPNPSPPPPQSSRKRKQPNPRMPDRRRKRNQTETLSGGEIGDDSGNGEEQETTVTKHAAAAKKPSGKTNSSHSNSGGGGGGHKEARWAEQLLNPCASAISAGNLSRIQHLLCVLNELASVSGDANHRLAAHGLRALTNHLPAHGLRALTNHLSGPAAIASPPTFSSTESRVFQNSLIKFHELSPWFSSPNALANASILQTLTLPEPTANHQRRNLQIVDIGVSHGIQWPTLLGSLSERPDGPPPLVRLTVVGPAGIPTAFSSDPPGDDYPSRLLRFAKRINVNLQIDRIENQPLQSLTPKDLGIGRREEETLIICAQFRLHQLPHEGPDDRTEFLQRMRDMEPDLVVLTENEGECSCSSCGGGGDFASGFPRRVEFLWKFLDSTSAAFKGRECEERRVMEGEAATALSSAAEMNQGKVRWCERMRSVGFVTESFVEEAIEGGRALLRKYDSNWEMRAEEGRCVSLCWKGHPVSFCSLWKLPTKKKG